MREVSMIDVDLAEYALEKLAALFIWQKQKTTTS